MKNMGLIFPDELSANNKVLSAIKNSDPLLLYEPCDSFYQLKHHKHKLVLLISGLRHWKKELEKDIELLNSQVDRCNEILKRLTLNPVEEDEFIDKDINIRDYLSEIISSFKEISKKEFVLNFDQDSNSKKITKSIEIVYGLRNFIGNANKFAKNTIFINLNSDSEITEITIEDDGDGYPRDIISKIGEPYLKSNYSKDSSKEGLGLGLFIGKTLLEKNFALVNCRNSKTRSGAEVNIKWKNRELFNI